MAARKGVVTKPVVTDCTALLSGNYWTGIGQAAATRHCYLFVSDVRAGPRFVGRRLYGGSALELYRLHSDRAGAGDFRSRRMAAAWGLIFVEVAPGQGDIDFQNVDFSTTNNPSYDLDASGDVFMNSQFINPDGSVSYGTLLHEIGHAIGLKHPTEVVTDYAEQPIRWFTTRFCRRTIRHRRSWWSYIAASI